MCIRIERSVWAVARWTFAASLAAASFIYILSQIRPTTAVAG